MTFTIDLSLLTNWVFWVAVYAVGYLVAVNVAMIICHRKGYSGVWHAPSPDYVFGPILWPLVLIMWVATLPARLLTK